VVNVVFGLGGPILEKYIKIKYKMEKINSSSCNGDLKCKKYNFEIKTSNGGKENDKFNFIQIRMNHNCDYILSAYYLDYKNLYDFGELFIFRLTKEDMKKLLLKYGSYAHGTFAKLGKIEMKDLDNNNNSKEYSLRPKYNSKCWNELLAFRVEDITI
jgi:hypothetical protein